MSAEESRHFSFRRWTAKMDALEEMRIRQLANGTDRNGKQVSKFLLELGDTSLRSRGKMI